MKILLFTYDYGIDRIYNHFYNWLIKNLPEDKIDVKLIVNQDVYNLIINNAAFKNLHPIVLTSENFNNIFQNNNLSIPEQLKIIYKNEFTNEQSLRLRNFLKINLKDWEPDIILTTGNESAYYIFKNIYPTSLCLAQENAIFSRYPFMRTMLYDPYSAIINNFYKKYVDKIKKYEISNKKNAQIEHFKKNLQTIIEKNSPISSTLKELKIKFNKLVLLPLVGDVANTFLSNEIYYNKDFDLVEYIMQNIPPDIGVIITEHDQGGIMHGETLEYFRNKYPNFIFIQNTITPQEKFRANSLHYYAHVDAVINTISKTGLTAVLWDKPIISMAKGYNDWIKDMDRLDDQNRLTEVLNMGKSVKNNVLCWYFETYAIFEKDFYKKDFLWDYLNTKLEKYRKNGITFEYFEKINDLNDIFLYIINYVKKYPSIFQKLNRQRIRLLSHITTGKAKEHYVNKWKDMKHE